MAICGAKILRRIFNAGLSLLERFLKTGVILFGWIFGFSAKIQLRVEFVASSQKGNISSEREYDFERKIEYDALKIEAQSE